MGISLEQHLPPFREGLKAPLMLKKEKRLKRRRRKKLSQIDNPIKHAVEVHVHLHQNEGEMRSVMKGGE